MSLRSTATLAATILTLAPAALPAAPAAPAAAGGIQWTVPARWTFGADAPSNCFAQRATLSSMPPPCPVPKKKTAHSPASAPFAAGTAYVATLMALPAPEVHRVGTVHWIPPAAEVAGGAARRAAGARVRIVAARVRRDMWGFLLERRPMARLEDAILPRCSSAHPREETARYHVRSYR